LIGFDQIWKKMNYVEDVDGKFNFLNFQVVIIGAGLSGLRAAKELIKKGITSIKIVEARNVKNKIKLIFF
jgi:ribulose 1,5-bisphosphate synthetase/thiazole synthase